MTAVACRATVYEDGQDLWDLLKAGVRRHGEEEDGRPVVADSKLVFSQTRGLSELERGVLATVGFAAQAQDLMGFVDRAASHDRAELCRECWYRGDSPLPSVADADACRAARSLFQAACGASDVRFDIVRSVIVCPDRFNQILDEYDTKAAVLAKGVHHFLRLDFPVNEPVFFFIDKQGGRNNYAPMLQHALPEGMVIAHEEGRERSVYRWVGGTREMRFTFEPRADFAHLCVALASMVSKYLRELLMAEFNRFWQGHVPGLKPTAGYPSDALRFFQAIRPHLVRLGVAENSVWRRK
jgi:hypothetical protein